MTKDIRSFMEKYFDGLILRPPLFYSWKFGLRFEIAIPEAKHEEERNLQQMEQRTGEIFRSVFQPKDELLLVTDVHCEKQNTFLQKRPIKVYQKYVKQKQLLYKLQHRVMPHVFIEEDMVTHRFVLPCQTADVRYSQLLQAITFEDFPHPAQILKGEQAAGYDIYFVNVTRKMIYHLYDDRGCDVIASEKEALRSLYEKHYDWTLQYDRSRMDQLFI